MGQQLDEELKTVSGTISIIMPCYNAQDYIGDAIGSVIRQTWQQWELWVVDDGSKDHSREIVARFAANDARVKLVINEKNLGVSITRNNGIELASGEWIAFLDSDDVWEDEKLERQLLLAQQKSAQFLFTGCSIIDQNGTILGTMLPLAEKVTLRELQKWNRITCSSVLLARQVLGSMRFEHDDAREDYLLWLRVLRGLDAAYAVNEPLVRYRIVDGSRSAAKVKMLRDTFRVHRYLGTGSLSSIHKTVTHFYYAFWHKYHRIGKKKC